LFVLFFPRSGVALRRHATGGLAGVPAHEAVLTRSLRRRAHVGHSSIRATISAALSRDQRSKWPPSRKRLGVPVTAILRIFSRVRREP